MLSDHSLCVCPLRGVLPPTKPGLEVTLAALFLVLSFLAVRVEVADLLLLQTSGPAREVADRSCGWVGRGGRGSGDGRQHYTQLYCTVDPRQQRPAPHHSPTAWGVPASTAIKNRSFGCTRPDSACGRGENKYSVVALQ